MIIQGYNIMNLQNAQSISLYTFIIFTLLHMNGICYSIFIAKDKMLIIGTALNFIGCGFVVALKLIYGWIFEVTAYRSPLFLLATNSVEKVV